ncbi:hypothetical protein EC973_000008 [Apophysomyces ossiformis]|uniref:2-deoxy-D-gluconate 3-dehydrogenase n=1 Tax=Apophysomyces ossiformis TaxID=679940 RepID=A0A8H7BZC2_9FUNG|nr:hypothetical protein EC973_000008 [Apophysomyces ossiformis]
MSSSLFSLDGKIAAITGCTRGIGRSMAIALAEAGADVCLLQRDVHNKEVQKEIQALGRRCEIVYLDVSKQDSVNEAMDKILSVFPTLDILVNNAGIQKRHPSVDFPEEDWDLVMQCNLKSVWTLSQAAGRVMMAKQQQGGKIINIGSLLSFQGGVTVPAYAAAKAAVANLTKALSNEWAKHGINVNAIAPGYIYTDMNTALVQDPVRSNEIMARIPAGRWGNPDDFKGPVIFLASQAGQYVHGEIIVVDGGWMGMKDFSVFHIQYS